MSSEIKGYDPKRDTEERYRHLSSQRETLLSVIAGLSEEKGK